MALITDKEQVLGIYAEAAKKKWVLPCFCTENLTTTEAILSAAKAYADEKGIPDLPITIAITVQYSHRTQAEFYTHTRRWDIGLKLFMADLRVLTDAGGPYENLRVMVHLDHVQFDDDAELLAWDMGQFSSIMFDASKVSFDENIRLTKAFVEARGTEIVVEGACDEIVDASGQEKSEMTTPGHAERFCRETGVDLIVANLGTEHRASARDLQYYGEIARSIKEKIGTRIVLHGASSVPGDQISNLMEDGVCKVNLWTTLERDSSPELLKAMVMNASRVVGREKVEELKAGQWLGSACEASSKADLGYFTTAWRQQVVFGEMVKIVRSYLDLWYR
jgi:fructose/tagatose bisphosphate aldolase